MKLFIDSADVEKIKEAWSWGIIDGVTTNPSHVAKTGRKHLDVYREICDIMDVPHHSRFFINLLVRVQCSEFDCRVTNLLDLHDIFRH